MTDTNEGRPARPWLRPWLVVGLAAWVQIGVILVARANREGLVSDISISPYHVVGYAALLTLGVYVAWVVFRAFRRGAWREAFPPNYGGLGLGFLLLVGWVVLDPIWRDTLGIDPGISESIAPTRLLIFAALALLAAGPLREAIAARSRPGLERGELAGRWAGVVAAGLIVSSVTLTAFNPVEQPLNDFNVNAGVDRTEIWTMAADGSSQTRVLQATGNGVDYSAPVWSPDGKRIAYMVWTNLVDATLNLRYQDQSAAVWTMAADGTDPRMVATGDPSLVPADDAGVAGYPTWSPDGQWIAYQLSPLNTHPAVGARAAGGPGNVGPPTRAAGASIWIANPDGSGKVRLTGEGVDAVSPSWSPDGTKLAYAVGGIGGTTDVHVATISIEGASRVLLLPKLSDDRVIAADPAMDGSPAWSPDGTRIVFDSDRAGYDSSWIASIDGSSLEQFRVEASPGPTGFNDWVPAWSPDGKRIAFVSDRTGEAEIWSAAVDGSDLRNLSNNPQHYDGQWSIAWSPDGSRLAYATGSFGDAGGSGWVREDYASAQAILFGLALAILALLIVAFGAPLGSFTVATTIAVALGALSTNELRFIPGAIAAGLVVDGLVRSVPSRWRARVAASALAGLGNLAIGVTIAMGGTLAWSITLFLGVCLASAALGWGLAEAVERLLQRVPTPSHEQPGMPAG